MWATRIHGISQWMETKVFHFRGWLLGRTIISDTQMALVSAAKCGQVSKTFPLGWIVGLETVNVFLPAVYVRSLYLSFNSKWPCCISLLPIPGPVAWLEGTLIPLRVALTLFLPGLRAVLPRPSTDVDSETQVGFLALSVSDSVTLGNCS